MNNNKNNNHIKCKLNNIIKINAIFVSINVIEFEVLASFSINNLLIFNHICSFIMNITHTHTHTHTFHAKQTIT